ncbi:hypothetical protein VHEMI03684 [[Torrubiella] hemipterigena]|uniref:U6 snRNA phosphodiesterase n=1 Tax=[Torrubiella] hemipterigena TaxID=1531966 RepID=A0A0A1SZ89_9HYPO|nr:hypothetical protein VHEMI03684 [[Torrubiella] hemipterigena]
MPLVNYSSSDTDDENAKAPLSKRRRGNSGDGIATTKDDAIVTEMPPLPDAFHDLYASTVRQSTVDDPNLHQGRKRQNPHVIGQWPSHVYVEWNPDPEQHQVLSNLLTAVSTALGDKIQLHQFLTSDLGAALPLHISLSRPISLATDEKDKFLDQVSSHISLSRVQRFYVKPKRLAWFTSPDSNRTFLVLQVESDTGTSEGTPSKNTTKAGSNPELMGLLKSCNRVAGRLGKPLLYQRQDASAQGSEFHVSIAWTFDTPTDEEKARASVTFEQEEAGQATSQWRIETSSVKVKIGNVVSSVSLVNGRAGTGLGSRLLLEEGE